MTLYTSPLPDRVVPAVSITERMFEGLTVDPDRVVLVDGPTGRSVTGAALMHDIRRLAGGLTAHGFGAGHVVAMLAPNMPEYCTVFHGVAFAGGTITTMNPTYTAPELRDQLTSSGAELLIVTPDFLALAQEAARGTKVQQIAAIGGAEGALSLVDLMGAPLDTQVPVNLATFPVVLPYSSGTSGRPKGVMLSHRNLVANVDQTLALLDVEPDEATVAFLPFFHIYGMNVLMNAFLTAGMRLVTMPRFDLAAFLGLLQDHAVRRVLIVPPVALALAKHPMVDQFDLSALRILTSGAAPMSADLEQACTARLGTLTMQGYGMTESSPVTHLSSEAFHRPGSAGICAPNTQCRIVDIETGAALPAGQEGELWVKGPQVMLGYLNNPEASAQTVDAAGWLHTGDIAAIDADGYLFIRDRLKELIKVNGFQVAPAELEAALQAHPSIQDAAVIGITDDETGEAPMAFVVTKAGADLSDVPAFLHGRLASYKVPVRIVPIEAIPKSASGKILRRLLRDRVAQGEF